MKVYSGYEKFRITRLNGSNIIKYIPILFIKLSCELKSENRIYNEIIIRNYMSNEIKTYRSINKRHYQGNKILDRELGILGLTFHPEEIYRIEFFLEK